MHIFLQITKFIFLSRKKKFDISYYQKKELLIHILSWIGKAK